MSSAVRVSKEGPVATVTLNRPGKHNAVNLEMFASLVDAGSELSADPSVRAIVLNGDGESFCAGIDLSVLQAEGLSQLASKMEPEKDSPANFFQRAAYIWREVPQPVICALHGVTFGAGFQIAMGADLRYASPDCRLSVMEIKWGIIPDMAISRTLAGILPVDRLKELAWTGRVVDAAEALQLGLVTAVVDDPQAVAMEQATAIAGRSPGAIRAIKRLFEESPAMTAADALQLEARLQKALLGGPNQVEAVAANLEKRAPNFAD
ncbi:MAG: crotonase/enoyl-CoA hydratase family protein [Woeseiaceae bacterium]